MSGQSILLLQGDAEAALLANAETAIETIFPGSEVRVSRAWTTRPDWIGPLRTHPPAPLVQSGALPDEDIPALLAQRHALVVLSLLPSVAVPALRHRDGGTFLAHRGIESTWDARTAEMVRKQCVELLPLTAESTVTLFEPIVERLLAEGAAVALCTAFRHVAGPLHFRRGDRPPLREDIRRLNLEITRLSHRSGCFVLDVDRVLSEKGGARLGADCFGGGDAAADAVLDEFAALLLDALPEGLAALETA